MKAQLIIALLSVFAFLSLANGVFPSTAGAHILVPQAYLRAQVQYTDIRPNKKEVPVCRAPQPYTGAMQFRSRYEGSGKARDTVNRQADDDFRKATASITSLQQFVAHTTDRIVRNHGRQGDIDCLITTLVQWAGKDVFLQPTDNYTARAVRKWTLAALSSNLLKVWNIIQKKGDRDDVAVIQLWISTMADRVVSDYSNVPMNRMNNHHYWAAWAVMTSAALLDRDDLYAWAQNIFEMAMAQVDAQGYLANELRRNSRAALYHNFALAPLVGMAVFLDANGTNPFLVHNQALARLTSRVLESVSDNAQDFLKVTGTQQDDTNFTEKGQLAWVAMYATIANLGPSDVAQQSLSLSRSGLKLYSTRLGGDLNFLYVKHMK